MRKALFALFVVVAGLAATGTLMRQRPSRPAEPVAANKSTAKMSNQVGSPTVAEEPADTFVASTPPAALPPTPPAIQLDVAVSLSPSLQMIVSRQSSYAQKQTAWKQLRDTHQLDEAIAELERAVKADLKTAEYPAALGIAYVEKLRTLQDFREQTVLAIKADQTFDQALELDASNWDARFWKALSLSYWPAALNKTSEVIDNLVTLVEQQEGRPRQPQFAQTYVLLGEQYQKAGYADYARETWQRGAAMFPDNSSLREKQASLQ